MGFYGSRFFIPPNSDPLNEVADPLVWTEQKHYGAQMAIRMASEGVSGVEKAAVFPADFMPGFSHSPVKPLRIAMYRRGWGGNMDEGWTRWLLEQYGFEYTTVTDKEVKEGLEGSDVFILPSDPPALITGEGVEEWYEKRFKGAYTAPILPPEYKTGIGEDGVGKVKEFVDKGGRVLALYESCEFAVEKLGVP